MAWLTGWQYRKKITISGSSGAGTNYQVLLRVGESSGATGAHFHVEGKSANFPSGKNNSGDLIFTASDGQTLLNFWVEQVTGTSPNRIAYCWVKVSADLGTNQEIFCYYGNPSATNVSNGDATFLAFDDFEGTSIDTTKWDTSGVTILSYGNSMVNYRSNTSNHRYLLYKLATFTNHRIMARQKDLSLSPVIGIVGRKLGLNQNTVSVYYYRWYDLTGNYEYDVHHILKRTSTGSDVLLASYNNVGSGSLFYLQEFLLFGTSLTAKCYNDDHTLRMSFSATDSDISSGYVGLFAEWNDKNIYTDWFFVAKYVSPEPAFSSAGPEETIPAINTQLSFATNLKTTERINPITSFNFSNAQTSFKETIRQMTSFNFWGSASTMLGRIVQGVIRRIINPRGGGIIKNR